MKSPFSKIFQGKSTPAANIPSTHDDPTSEAAKESVTMSDPSTTDNPTNQPSAEASAANDGSESAQATQAAPSNPQAAPSNPQAAPSNPQAAPSNPNDERSDADVDDALTAIEIERDEFKDQYLRAKAEAENIRRRADQQRSNDRKYANEAFARELLDVRESLDHAGSVELDADTNEASQQMRAGLELTVKQLDAAMEKFHIEAVAPQAGEKFDAEWHQAMSMQPVEGIATNHVVSTIRKGYRLHDRLLRPAMVIVSNTPGNAETTRNQTSDHASNHVPDKEGDSPDTAADDAPAS